ncbi:asparagine synthase-related protein [Planktotalea sp.]|uniref:asparagine synthase-related protein n=1 Tax=Planktotalea sp. TaxID=2029877 RepID=UPI00329A45B1
MTIGRFIWPTAGKAASSTVELVFFTGRIDNKNHLAEQCDLNSVAPLRSVLETLYERFGVTSADLIIGDFVIAFWDPEKRSIICFRDVSGCGIAYYHSGPRHFVIAETIENVLVESDASRDIDKPFARQALERPLYHPEHTFLIDIKKVPPAHVVTITPKGRTLTRYWSPRDIAPMDYSNPESAHQRFREIYRQAVKDRLPDHDNIGVHISGGLDCTSVAILATEILRETKRPAPTAFAWQPHPDHIETLSDNPTQTWKDAHPHEYELLDSATDELGLELQYCPIIKQDCLEIWDRDETVNKATGGIYGEWPVQKRAQSLGVKVLLSGVGGDEVASFNGRGYLPGLALRFKWFQLYKFAKATGRNGFKAIASELRAGLYALLLPETILQTFIRESPYGVSKWKSLLRVLTRRTRTNFLLSSSQRAALSHRIPMLNRDAFAGVKPLPAWPDVRKTSARNTMCDSFERGQICERLEGWAGDGAKHGLTYVYPLLDKRVLEFCFALPEHAFQNPHQQRLFFRQAMAPILPDLICSRPKGTEPARAGAGMQAGVEALIEYGKRLKRGEIKSPRLDFIDRDKLLDSLEENNVVKNTGVARRLLAVQFIGLGSK